MVAVPLHASDFDPNQYPIPVSHPSDHAVATAFLGRAGGKVALYTAAHNLAAGTVPARRWPRVDGWTWVARTLHVHTSRDTGSRPAELVEVDPGSGPGDSETCRTRPVTPTFAFLHAPDDDTTIWDAVRLPRSMTSALFSNNLDRFGVVDLDELNTPPPGSPLICVGYPPIETSEPRKIWPQDPPARLTGTLLGSLDGHYQASFASVKGFSGGPTFTSDGQFVGMLTGNDVTHFPAPRRDLSRIVRPEVLRLLKANETA